MKIRLLQDADFQGVLHRIGEELEAEPDGDGFSVQMGIGSYLYLNKYEAEMVPCTPDPCGKLENAMFLRKKS